MPKMDLIRSGITAAKIARMLEAPSSVERRARKKAKKVGSSRMGELKERDEWDTKMWEGDQEATRHWRALNTMSDRDVSRTILDIWREHDAAQARRKKNTPMYRFTED